MRILVSIPTLGLRPDSLRLTIASLRLFLPEADLEIITPNTERLIESSILEEQGISIIADDSDQRGAILKSWKLGNFDWYTWINDDDFALAGVKSGVALAQNLNESNYPLVIFGDLTVMSDLETKRIATPRFINTWLLASGSDYVPGLLTLINKASLEVLIREENNSKALRNSFDYHWWLQLAQAGAIFKHSRSSHAIWRDHPNARTQIEIPHSLMETEFIKSYYLPFVLKIPIIRTINSLTARILARLLSNRIKK